MPLWKHGDYMGHLLSQKGDRVGRIYRGHLDEDELTLFVKDPIVGKVVRTYCRSAKACLFQQSKGHQQVLCLQEGPARGNMEATVIYDAG